VVKPYVAIRGNDGNWIIRNTVNGTDQIIGPTEANRKFVERVVEKRNAEEEADDGRMYRT
jgi:hypothetical protein